MATTPRGYYYPVASDPSTVPAHLADLAGDVNTDVDNVETNINSLEATTATWKAGYESALVARGTAQSVPNSANTNIAFTSDVRDLLDWHSLTTNTDQIIVGAAGFYLITLHAEWVGSSSGTYRWAGVTVDGFAVALSVCGVSSTGSVISHCAAALRYLAAGAVVRAYLNQNSGAALNTGNTQRLNVVRMRL